MTVDLIIGIDPGKHGAFAGIDGRNGKLLWVEDMPLVDKAVSPTLVAQVLRLRSDDADVQVVVERVHSMTGQGVSTTFTFGVNYGIVLGAAAWFPVQTVPPTSWKKWMRVTADKETSRARALALWPEHAETFKRKMDADRAEAALIGRWWWEAFGDGRRPVASDAGVVA